MAESGRHEAPFAVVDKRGRQAFAFLVKQLRA